MKPAKILIKILPILSFVCLCFQTNFSYSKEIKEARVTGSYLAGSYASRNNDDGDASNLFLNVISEKHDNITLLERSYKIMLLSGEVDNAVAYAKKYLKKNKHSQGANVLVAIDHIKNSQYQDAITAIENAQEENEDELSRIDYSVLRLLNVWALAGLNKNDEAIARLKNMAKNGDVPEFFFRYLLSILYEVAGDNTKARKQYNILVNSIDSMPYHFTKSVALFYEKNGNKDLAKSLYQTYLNRHRGFNHFSHEMARVESGKDITIHKQRTVLDGALEVIQEAARVLYGSEYYSESAGYLRLSLHLDHNADEQKIILASYYENNDKYDSAMEIYNTIDAESDFYLSARLAIADNMHEKGDEKNAYKELNRLSTKYDSEVARITLADLLRKDKEYKKASEIYTKIIDSKEQITKHDWPLMFARGICYERISKWQEAEKDLVKALELNPGQPDVLNYLGYSWVDRDINIKKAKEMVARAVKARPNDPQIVDSMGWVLYKMKDFENASVFLEKAVEIKPNDAVINDHLGDAYWHAGRKNEAVFQWNKAIKFSKNSDVKIADIENKIENGL